MQLYGIFNNKPALGRRWLQAPKLFHAPPAASVLEPVRASGGNTISEK